MRKILLESILLYIHLHEYNWEKYMKAIPLAQATKLLLVLLLLIGLSVLSAISTKLSSTADYSTDSHSQPNRAIKYVRSTATGSNNGSSWTNAYTSLQSALNAAVSGDQIWVAKGTYRPSNNYGLGVGFRYYHFRMKNGVGIYGGFTGTETAVSQRANFRQGETNETILSGELGTIGSNTDNCYHVLYHPSGLGLTSSAILDGFTIRDGYANEPMEPHCNGSAIYIDNNDPSLNNLTIVSNQTNAWGAVYIRFSDVSISNSIFKSNQAWIGGAVFATQTNLTMINCLITQNTADYGAGVKMDHFTSNASFINCTITNNTATYQGGGLDAGASTSILKNCIVWGNTSGESGRQIYSTANVTMNYCCYANTAGDINVTGSLVTGNCNTSDPQFVNSTSGDYRIYHTSPCVNTGNNANISAFTEIRGQARIQESTIDMGAYEWTNGIDPVRAIIYVKSDAIGSNNGSTWTNAYTSLQSALNEVVGGEEIWVARGTYKPSYDYGMGGGSRYYHFRMKNGVAIYGGFAGTESESSQRINFNYGDANETILSGDIGAVGSSGDNCYHVIYNPFALLLNSTAILDGFTIRDGNGTYSTLSTDIHNYGGGILNYYASPTLRGLTFTANNARYGGGMNNYTSSPIVINSLFFGNTAVDGGAIENSRSAAPNFTNCTIADNSSTSNGGAINNYNCSPTFNNSIVWGNNSVYGKQFNLTGGGTTTLNYSCYSNATNDVRVSTSVFNVSNSTTTNPNFSTISPNYHPQGTSPCVNTGNNAYNTLGTDMRGNLRIQNTTIDMGVYEWTNGSDPYSDILYVKHDATGANNGSSWQNAFTSLQSAMDAALAGVRIWVAHGTYYPTLDHSYNVPADPRNKCFRMIREVEIYGGFAGTESSVSQRINYGLGQSNETILSGDIGTIGNQSDNCYYVVDNAQYIQPDPDHIDNTAVLDGFTIRDGGVGMYNRFNSVTIRNMTFTAIQGDAMSNSDGGTPVIQNCKFIQNSGSGVVNESASLITLEGCVFSNNGNSGIRQNWGSLTVSNSTFEGNSSNSGGGISGQHVDATLSGCSFLSNNTTGTGAIILEFGSLSATNCSFIGNSSTWNSMYGSGAVTLVNLSNPAFTNCVFSNNSAVDGCGALFVLNCSGLIALTNTSFSSNSSAGTSDIACSTTAGYETSHLEINNSIIWSEGASQIYADFSSVAFNYSCYNASALGGFNSTFYETNHNISTDPCFVNAVTNDLRLTGYSPCTNTGENAYNALTTDIRGQARIQNAIIDMGAYEYTDLIDPAGSIIYVKHDATGANDGSSWNNALTSLQSALNISIPYSRIWIARGTYYPSSAYDLTNSPRYYHFRLQESVGIYGGFAGTENSLSQRADYGFGGANETILSGDIGVSGNVTDNCYHVIFNAGTALSGRSELNGVTITGGNANGTNPHNRGGGINLTTCSPTISQVIFTNNLGNHGGGAFNQSSSAQYYDCLFFQNQGNSAGGGLRNNSATVTVTNCTFANNTAGATGGGGIDNWNSNATYNNCIFWGNTSPSGNQIHGWGTGTTTLNYSCYANSANDVAMIETSGLDATNHCINTNPLLVDVTNTDYRIYGNSPARNTGSNAYNTRLQDLEGRVRIQNSAIDMGAYEWTTGTDPAVDPAIVTFTNGLSFTPGVSNGGTDQAIGRFALQTDGRTSELNSLTVLLAGTFSGTSNYKLWSSADNSFDSSVDIILAGGDEARSQTSQPDFTRNTPVQSNNRDTRSNLTFSGLTTMLNGEQKFFFISCDISAAASGSILPKIASQGSIVLNGGVIQPSFSNAQLCSGSISFMNPPENITISEEYGYIRLSWGTVSGANSYKIYVSDTPDGEFTFLVSTPTVTWTHLIEGERKFYRVTASTD